MQSTEWRRPSRFGYGAEGNLFELLTGEQIHIGGFKSSMDLAERAGIGAGKHGVDLCSATVPAGAKEHFEL
jgi:hypothetical protein